MNDGDYNKIVGMLPCNPGELFYIICYDPNAEERYINELKCDHYEIREDGIYIDAWDASGWWGEISVWASEDYEIYNSRGEALRDLYGFFRDLKEFPTIESRPKGKWQPHPDPENREWDVCSVCGIGTKRREYGLKPDGTEWMSEESYQHCPWCGAKLKEDR